MYLSIAIPASLVSDVPHLREKTSHLGMISRALAIFHVEEVIIYRDLPDKNQNFDIELISTILSYMETPQYLRKYLFPKIPNLNYAGILPPLRTPHHPIIKKIVALKDEEIREGVVVTTGKKTLVDIGVEHPIPLNEQSLSLWQRVTVRIYKENQKISIKRVKEQVHDKYWGYKVTVPHLSLGQIMRRDTFDLVILTSRYGKSLTEATEKLRSRLKETNTMLIAFGSPKQGLKEILEREGLQIDNINSMVLNTIPQQGVETVRTEEAIYTTLAIMNIMM
ncbi:RNA methyltransferase [Candidatus Bathyarchaeota archaeon]|nr:RNA methyltransferase [Candidatus Bathyarchaeota archaeon]